MLLVSLGCLSDKASTFERLLWIHYFDGRYHLVIIYEILWTAILTDKPERKVVKINDRGMSVCRSPIVHAHTSVFESCVCVKADMVHVGCAWEQNHVTL